MSDRRERQPRHFTQSCQQLAKDCGQSEFPRTDSAQQRQRQDHDDPEQERNRGDAFSGRSHRRAFEVMLMSRVNGNRAEYFPLIHIKKRRVSLYKNATEILVMPAAFLHADGIATSGELCASPAAGQ
jgi:hypothetical protein